ncbi:hypothetical protein FTX61_15235 [Nitriliruptoraceae bacterium ZYF776]|nr:hypothetical protein [Profundirhabdus halotolerans]
MTSWFDSGRERALREVRVAVGPSSHGGVARPVRAVDEPAEMVGTEQAPARRSTSWSASAEAAARAARATGRDEGPAWAGPSWGGGMVGGQVRCWRERQSREAIWSRRRVRSGP